jgi:PAS domain S-box-containing protein
MKNLPVPKNWLSHIVPLTLALVALITVALTPFWAFGWARLPFLGLFLEPHNVVSALENDDWPAKNAGIQSYDRLVAINGETTLTASEVGQALQQNGFSPVELRLETREGGTNQVTVTPRTFRVGELVSWFGVPYGVGLAFLGIGLWAYRMSKEQRPARAFLSFTAAFSITTVTYFDMNTTQNFILGWAMSIPIAAGALAHLALVFPRPMTFIQNRPILRLLPWGITILLAIPVTREILMPSHPWGYISTWFGSYAFSTVAIVLFLSSLLYRIFKDTSAVIRQQSRLIIFGAALAFGPLFFLFLLPSLLGELVRFPMAIVFPALAILPLSVSYSIVRYRMMDVDRLLGSTLSYVITASGAVLLYYLVLALLSLLIPAEIAPNDPLMIALFLFILVVFTAPIRNYIAGLIDRIFYRTRADYRRVLTHLSQELVVTPDMDHTLTLLEQEINAAIAPESGVLYLFDDDEAIYRPQRSIGDTVEISIPAENPFIVQLTQKAKAIWFPPGRELPTEIEDQAAILEEIGCRLYVPLLYEEKMIGFFGLGERRSGDPYTSDDLDFLDAVASQSSLALENVRLFANLQDTLDQTLEMKSLMDDIFQSMSSGVITTDQQRQITAFNQAAEKILGIPIEEMMGKSLPEVLAVLGPQFNMMTHDTIECDAEVLGEELTPDIPQRGPTVLRMSVTPLKDAQLGTKGATIVIDDLTEQRHLEAERERIRQTFGRVVAPRVRDRLLEDPSALRLDGVRQPLTVLFADIHKFTNFSERNQPEDLFEILNSYLSLAAQAVLEEEGTLDKFMGDAVMALWNAPDPQPDHTLRAARAAIAMNQAIREHRSLMSEENQLFFSVGINVGDAMVGNVGTPDLFNYTAIGDTVNYSQRLESIADPGQIILSKAAYEAIADHIIAKEMPPVKVKGKAEAAVVYELIGLK